MKGGTALSKCFKLIERFSEDIDLVIIRKESGNKLKGKLRKINTSIIDDLPEVDIEGITRKMGMKRKTAHSYTKFFTEKFGPVRELIILESSWLGYYEPYRKMTVNSLIGETLEKVGQNEYVKKYNLLPFKMNVLEPSRTICEKIMSLVRSSYTDNPTIDLKKKIRHTYDLHQLIQQAEFHTFINSSEFGEMLIKVANEDLFSFKNNNDWLTNHPNESLFFKNLSELWEKELKAVYLNNFKNIVFGNLPGENQVLASLKQIKKVMSKIDWKINF